LVRAGLLPLLNRESDEVLARRSATSNGRGDAEKPMSIRKDTGPVIATAPLGRRLAVMITAQVNDC
jgi:hypothetical protein